MPSNWKIIVWELAYHYHFPPESIWEMDFNDMIFWYEGIVKRNETTEDE